MFLGSSDPSWWDGVASGMPLAFLLGAASVLAGTVAAVSGFGVGSLLTPLLSLKLGLKVAVAVVSIPHLVASALRFRTLRAHVDRRVLVGFGIASASGGLAGALLHEKLESPVLSLVFAVLLIATGTLGLTGLSDKLKFKGVWGWIAGALSGIFGGLVGNQGGLRSAALLGFDLPRQSFVATATAIALFVDGARVPVYLIGGFRAIADAWPLLAVTTAGVVVGTFAGTRILERIPEQVFKRVVSGLILLLGLAVLAGALRDLRR
jgi:uncharacterized protein